MDPASFTVFVGTRAVASGGRESLRPVLARCLAEAHVEQVLVFDDATGAQTDLDQRSGESTAPAGSHDDLPRDRGPGRPRLGVVAREVTLLPRHWQWLNAQPGGASAALRRLVEHARREGVATDRVRRSREAAYRFLLAIAGDAPGFEEACRALFAGDRARFEDRIRIMPPDVAAYAWRLATDGLS